jgi:acetylornithine deacetylase/succinyl-diaminopimelate desuccinylase-like protein
VLEDAGLAVGVVEGIVGMTWTKVTVTGHANHVGTTPMALRKDALAAAASIISGVEQLGRQTPGAVATVGKIFVEPNNSGVIPGQVVCTVDFCHRDLATLDALVTALHGLAATTMEERGVVVQSKQIWWSDPAPFAAEIIDLVDEACTSSGRARCDCGPVRVTTRCTCKRSVLRG